MKPFLITWHDHSHKGQVPAASMIQMAFQHLESRPLHFSPFPTSINACYNSSKDTPMDIINLILLFFHISRVPLILSPITFTHTLLLRGPSNSQKNTDCQVPSANLPSSISTCCEHPIRLALIWAAAFPSQWVY